MGNRQVNAVLKSNAGVTMGARFTLVVLADRASDQIPTIGYCYPSYNWIAKRVRCSKKTIERAIKLLQKEGHLIVRSKHEGGTLSHHYLVTTGLSDEEIEGTLISQFEQTEEGAYAIVKEVRKRQARIVKLGYEDSSNPSFFEDYPTNCPSPPDNLSQPTRHSDQPTRQFDQPTRQNVAQSLSYSSADPSADPSARESRSLENNNQSNLKNATNETLSALSAKKGSRLAKQADHKSSTHANPPSPAAPPSPNPSTGSGNSNKWEVFYAVVRACGMKMPSTKRKKQRLMRKVGDTVAELIADGHGADEVAIMRKWWDQVGLGSRGGTPPHPSQVEMYIDTALAWAKAGSPVATSKPRGEYLLATEQPVQNQDDVVATRQMYENEEFEVNEYGF